jgi:anhydro-N-acetylmuramic acid kinase
MVVSVLICFNFIILFIILVSEFLLTCSIRTQGREHMDTDGRYGQAGQVSASAMQALHDQAIRMNGVAYFAMLPPKSLDINDMRLIPALDGLSLEDGCATLAAFTADTIANSFDLLPLTLSAPSQWVLCGGGWYNPNIRNALTSRLVAKFGGDVRVHTADEVGWNNQYMEAQVFAYLAVRSAKKLPLSLPTTTGVPEPLTGGDYYTPQK